MFLLRAAFWLAVVILLIPADPQSGAEAPRVTAFEALSAARTTIADMSAFCERNPDVCVTGSAAAALFAEKAENGVRLLYRYFHSEGDEGAPNDDPARGTLTPRDLEPDWRGSSEPDAAA